VPRAIQEEPMLRISDLCLAGSHLEKGSVEELDPF
jgi:hypothetical protein